MSDSPYGQQPGLDDELEETGNRRKLVLVGAGATVVVGALAAGLLVVPNLLGSNDGSGASGVTAAATVPTPSPSAAPSMPPVPPAATVTDSRDPFKPLLVAAQSSTSTSSTSTNSTGSTNTTTTATGTGTTSTTVPVGGVTGTTTGTTTPGGGDTGSTGGTAPAPTSHDLRGTLTVYSPTPAKDANGKPLAAGECVPAGNGYADIHNGTAVTVRDSTSTVVGHAKLQTGTLVDQHTEQMPVVPSDPTIPPDQWPTKNVQVGFCRFSFTVTALPNSEYYAITVAKRAPLTMSEVKLNQYGWNVELTLG